MTDPDTSHPAHSDYHEKVSVASEHAGAAAAAAREKPDPKSGSEPMSLWAFFLCGIALVVGGSYFGSNASGFSMSQYAINGYTPMPKPPSGDEGPVLPPGPKWLKEGKKLYSNICQACHMPNGMGQAGQYPPLAGSEWVTGGTERLAMMILNGVTGPITVAGSTYNNAMQPWEGMLNDQQLAQVMSYIRTEWGNADLLPEGDSGFVNTAMAAEARARHASKGQVTVADVADFNVDLPGGPVDPETIE